MVHVLLVLHARQLQGLAIGVEVRTALNLLLLKFAIYSHDFGAIDDNGMVLSMLLVLQLDVLTLHDGIFLHQRRPSVFRAMLRAIVLLKLLLQIEIIFGAFLHID